MYLEGSPIQNTLQAYNNNTPGEDRISDYVPINYGKYGFYFNEPGEYLVKTVYYFGDMVISSNPLRVVIGYPTSKEESRLAHDFFTYEVGMFMYLNGSESPFLSQGKKILESLSDKYKNTLVGAKISTILAASEARPFFRIQDNVLKQTHKPNYKKALDLTEAAIEVYRKQNNKHYNILYHHLVKIRADALIQLGRRKDAVNEISSLHKDLATRDVNESVLKSIKQLEESIKKGVK